MFINWYFSHFLIMSRLRRVNSLAIGASWSANSLPLTILVQQNITSVNMSDFPVSDFFSLPLLLMEGCSWAWMKWLFENLISRLCYFLVICCCVVAVFYLHFILLLILTIYISVYTAVPRLIGILIFDFVKSMRQFWLLQFLLSKGQVSMTSAQSLIARNFLPDCLNYSILNLFL